jgi:hypothetical protein
MSAEAKQDVVGNLMGCALSLSAFYISGDISAKLMLLQNAYKEYSALSNKLASGNISVSDLDIATPVAKEKLSTEIERRTDIDFDAGENEKLAHSSPSKIDQMVNFLKQKRDFEINVSVNFKEPEEEET